jgi:hypothetical protein
MRPNEFSERAKAALRVVERLQEPRRARVTEASMLLRWGKRGEALAIVAALATDACTEEERALWLSLGETLLVDVTEPRPGRGP